PTPEIARALGRTIERQALLDRLEGLERDATEFRVQDPETGLYPTWRFDEEWRLEQARARRRGGDLGLLMIGLETGVALSVLAERHRITLLRQVGRIIKSALRDGDLAVH